MFYVFLFISYFVEYICLNHPEQVWSPNSMLQAEFSSPPMINFNTTSGYDFDQNRSRNNTLITLLYFSFSEYKNDLHM